MEEYVEHNSMVPNGKESFRQFVQGRINAMPDLKWEPIFPCIASGDQVWSYRRYIGTFKNDWMGMKANNKKIVLIAFDIIRVENGKIAEHWDVMDRTATLDQMTT